MDKKKKEINVCDECLLRNSMACPASAICESKEDKPYFVNEIGKAIHTAYCMGLIDALETTKFSNPYETVSDIVDKVESIIPGFVGKRKRKKDDESDKQ